MKYVFNPFTANFDAIRSDSELDALYLRLDTANDPLTNQLAIHGSADISQLVVRANATQSNTNPLILLEASDGTDLLSIHSDDVSNLFMGVGAGDNNAVSGADGVQNLFIGNFAGCLNTSGANNVSIGALSLYYNQTGDYNVCIGDQAGLYALGGYNICIGKDAGKGVLGFLYSSNTFIGFQAGYLTTTGSSNFGMGYRALWTNATGGNNISIGLYSMYSPSDPTYNVCIGNYAGFGVAGNSYIRSFCLGYGAGYSQTTSADNLFIGYVSGYKNTSGSSNICIGSQAGYHNITNHGNVLIGAQVGYGTEGDSYQRNSVIGTEAFRYPTTASNNTIVGYRGGYTLTTGRNNILIGYQAGDNLTTGTNNIIIGYDVDASAIGVTNELNIGDLITADLSTGNTQIDGELSMNTHKITSVVDPTADQDASTKKYVDDQGEKGGFSISNEVVAMGTTFTKTIPLGHTDFTMGRIMLYVPVSVLLTSTKRMCSFIMFTTELNNAIAESGGKENYNVYGYNFTNSWTKGFYYNNDSKLSDVYFFDNGSQTGLRGQLRIESCQIVGDTIELKFRNTHATRNTNLTIDGRYEVHM